MYNHYFAKKEKLDVVLIDVECRKNRRYALYV